MATVPFALSVHKFVSDVGADCGFAALIGLALLVLLYFAQARETSSLRDRLTDSDNRSSALEGRIAQILRAQATAPRAPGPGVPTAAPTLPPTARPGFAAGAAAGRAAGAVAAQPMGSAVASVRRLSGAGAVGAPTAVGASALTGAPAGMGAPALNSATKLIPTPAAVPAGIDLPDSDGIDDTVFSGPATAAGGNGQMVTPPPFTPPPVEAPEPVGVGAYAGGYAGATGATQVAGVPPRVQIRDELPPPPPRRTAPPAAPPPGRRSLLRRVLPLLVGIVIVAVVVVVLLSATGGGGSGTKTVNHTTTTARTKKHRPGKTAPAFKPSSVTVSVLNGTAVNGLAAKVAGQLTPVGYKVPVALVTNASSATETTTTVGYMVGKKADALQVAKALKLSDSHVVSASQAAIQVCEQPATSASTGSATTGTCNAQVIVTVGSDLAGLASSTTTSP
jgi:LytR cell envelope-related transcriptional attenuator